jgi:DNA-binding MarR family transcriptional regulator
MSKAGKNGSLNGVELGAWRGFVRAHATVWRELEVELERSHKLPLSSFTVLIELEQADAHRLRMSELANRVSLSRSGLSRLVDRLERAGLTERETCAEDLRGAFAVLTRRGYRRLQEVKPVFASAVTERFLRHYNEAELAAFTDLCGRLVEVGED